LVLDRHDGEPEACQLSAGTAVVYSRRSPGKETANEDGALLVSVDSQRAVLAVADGCGGMSDGEQAAKVTLNALCSAMTKPAALSDDLRAAILDGIEQANEQVVALGTGAAATLAVVEVRDGRVRPFHVGDSQILLVGGRGKVKLQTSAHAPVAYAVEAGMLSEEEAIHHEERHLVSNVIGDRDSRIEIGSGRKMSPRDTLLLASDGILDNLHIEEIVELIRKGPLEQAATRLAAKTWERMQAPVAQLPSKPDDATFILFRLSENSAAAR
jgi:serine/threonine protein phosphatase PrpC